MYSQSTRSSCFNKAIGVRQKVSATSGGTPRRPASFGNTDLDGSGLRVGTGGLPQNERPSAWFDATGGIPEVPLSPGRPRGCSVPGSVLRTCHRRHRVGRRQAPRGKERKGSGRCVCDALEMTRPRCSRNPCRPHRGQPKPDWRQVPVGGARVRDLPGAP